MKDKNQHGLDRRSFLSVFPTIAMTPLLASPLGNAIAGDSSPGGVAESAKQISGIRYLSPLDANADTANHTCCAAPVMPLEGAGHLHTMTMQGVVGADLSSLDYSGINLSQVGSQFEHIIWRYDRSTGETPPVSFVADTTNGGVDLFLDIQHTGSDSYDRYQLAFRQSRLSMAPALNPGDYFIPLAHGTGLLPAKLEVNSARFLSPTSEELWERRVTDASNATQPYLWINVKANA